MVKKFILFGLLLAGSLQASAQNIWQSDSLARIVRDEHRDPESRVLACVLEGQVLLDKPGEDPKDIDSASAFLQLGRQLSKAFGVRTMDGELLLLESLIDREKGLTQEAARLNNLALTMLKNKPGSYLLGCALIEHGGFLDTDDEKQLNEKISTLKEAITCIPEARYVRVRAAQWKMLGDLYMERPDIAGNPAQALEAYQRSMQCYSSYGYKNIQDIYIELATVYRTLGDDQQGLHYCLLAMETAERAKDSSMTMCSIYNRSALQYEGQRDYVNAKKYYLLALELAEKLNSKASIFTIASNLYYVYAHELENSEVKRLLDRVHSRFPENDLQNQYFSNTFYLNYYTAIRDLSGGKKYCLQLNQLLNTASPAILRIMGRESYSAISEYYAKAHMFDSAYKYWGKAYALVLQYDNTPMNRSYMFNTHYMIDNASHNLSSGLSYLHQYSDLQDSMYTVSKAAREANLRALFDTKKKEYELAESRQKIEMLTQNEQLQRKNLKQVILMRNITIIFTLIIAVIGGLLFRQYISRKKAMKKIAKTNLLLEKLVSEKEWLLREVHHRVKNNLHTVICLLESQAAYLEKDALRAVEDSRHRIYAMSLIHQKLYENDDVKTIDMNDYVTALVRYLQDSYHLMGKITFHLQIAPVLIDAAIAIPIGLIINEAVTNAIKYAFVNRGRGEISIELIEDGEKIVLVVADNGAGIDTNLLNMPSQSMGLRLMRGLSGDIGGTITFSNKQGTEIRLICARILMDEEDIDLEDLLKKLEDGVES